MLKDASNLISYLEPKLDQIGLNKTKLNDMAEMLYRRHNMHQVRTMDIVSHRASIDEATIVELFCMTEYVSSSVLDHYFTESEIKSFSEFRFQSPEKIKMPLRIKCIKIADDQYIGSITTDMLMHLREAQMINYNVNAQRVQHMAIVGGMEVYKISLNRAAVRAIKESFQNGTYIPNTVTLNIPIKETSIFSYDESKSELVIKSLESFDITDGYHRYVAIAQLKDSDPTFNYPMEVRITNFSDDRSRSFIWQEDQKTRMTKVESDSMNMNTASNIVLNRMQNDSNFVLKDNVSRNRGAFISYGMLSGIINQLYFERENKSNLAARQLMVQKEVTDGLNNVATADLMRNPNNSLLNRHITFKELCIILYGIKQKCSVDQVFDALDRADELNPKKFMNGIPRKTLFNDIATLYERSK